MIDVEEIEGLDGGIKPVVKLLMEHDIVTFESCEGGEGHIFVTRLPKSYIASIKNALFNFCNLPYL